MTFAEKLKDYLSKAAFKRDHQAVVRKVIQMVDEELAPPRADPAPTPAAPFPAPISHPDWPSDADDS
jgi:hypothetical protein